MLILLALALYGIGGQSPPAAASGEHPPPDSEGGIRPPPSPMHTATFRRQFTEGNYDGWRVDICNLSSASAIVPRPLVLEQTALNPVFEAAFINAKQRRWWEYLAHTANFSSIGFAISGIAEKWATPRTNQQIAVAGSALSLAIPMVVALAKRQARASRLTVPNPLPPLIEVGAGKCVEYNFLAVVSSERMIGPVQIRVP